LGSVEIARSSRTIRVLETASPPTFYIPPDDVTMKAMERAVDGSLCEWKGQAAYWTVTLPGQRLERVGWSYPEPFPGFEAIRNYFAFYPAPLECFVDGIRVLPQPGRFYGGWVTPELVGPFKGEPGSETW
jgi:uncharacterized protein (DUF427 family)